MRGPKDHGPGAASQQPGALKKLAGKGLRHKRVASLYTTRAHGAATTCASTLHCHTRTLAALVQQRRPLSDSMMPQSHALGPVDADAAAARAADRAARERRRAAAARAHVPARGEHGVARLREAHHAHALARRALARRALVRRAGRVPVRRRAPGAAAAAAAGRGGRGGRRAALLLRRCQQLPAPRHGREVTARPAQHAARLPARLHSR